MDKNTPKAKGWRTALQSIAAVVGAYLYGLWQLPGVSEYTHQFILSQGLPLLLGLAAAIGIPAGLIAYFQNRLGK